ncbi:hypothetical protein PIB30_064919 [Stylosanthes scabra]|uniref:Uncharacterized protein n=1 Tax=Stylosanthes scabra TaxID=79078 RepID=A0ABU6ULV1_9FABA|nr:hypothetical protein [Stylosanthes scabra]
MGGGCGADTSSVLVGIMTALDEPPPPHPSPAEPRGSTSSWESKSVMTMASSHASANVSIAFSARPVAVPTRPSILVPLHRLTVPAPSHCHSTVSLPASNAVHTHLDRRSRAYSASIVAACRRPCSVTLILHLSRCNGPVTVQYYASSVKLRRV